MKIKVIVSNQYFLSFPIMYKRKDMPFCDTYLLTFPTSY